ncbi:MAG: M6 family metalloprotease domain-containing protein [Muribaculaceae bacterium]|nr:M6 family metalloprotease domain-containing protein [Muribaculaceae bacterium]
MNQNLSNAIKAAALAAVAFIGFTDRADAMPASPYPVPMLNPDGTYTDVLIHGDEYYHALTTVDGKHTLRRDASGFLRKAEAFDVSEFNDRRVAARKAPAARVIGSTVYPCFGKQRSIAILVDFPATSKHPEGRKFGGDDSRGLFDRLLNAPDYTVDGATGSVNKYFLDSSNGVFDVTFDVFGPVMMKKDVTNYIDDDEVWEMVVEAVSGVDDQVDFSQYDRDGDGIIDNVYIFYAGPGAATGGDPYDCIWQHASDVELLSGQQFVFDGKRLNHYACSNEYRDVREGNEVIRLTEGIGTVCHEFSHVLGLPDLYDVYYGGHLSPAVWDVMDTGCHLNNSRTPCQYSALDRMLLGWLDPQEIPCQAATFSLPEMSENVAYKINTDDPNEFFLLENRQQKGWDAELPGHGMLLWRINYAEDFWNYNQVNTGKSSSHAYVIPADGLLSNDTFAADPFPGTKRVTSITDDGYPNMLTSNGLRTNMPLSNIVEASGVVSFDVCRTITYLDKVKGLQAIEVTPTSFEASWEALPMSPGYLVNVYDAAGTAVGIYTDLNVAANTLTVAGLQPETEYSFTVQGISGAIKGEVSDPCSVTTPAMSFGFLTPAVLDATDVDSDTFTAHWLPVDGAVDYELSVYTMQVGEDRYATSDFTGGIDALPAGWSTNCINTMSMAGYYGAASPSLSMTTDYGRISSPLLQADLTAISFWYRERSASGKSHIEVSVLADGTWHEIDRIELNATSMPAGVEYHVDSSLIPAGAVAAQIVYRRVDKGTLALDDVQLRFRGVETATPLAAWNARVLGTSATEAKVDGLERATDYYYTVRGINADGVRTATSDYAQVRTAAESSLAGIAVEDVKVSVSADGVVSVLGATDFNVYDMTGREVGRVLPAHGIYIVKVNYHSVKIIF